MTTPRPRRRCPLVRATCPRRDQLRAVVVLLVTLVAAWLDGDGCIRAVQAGVFGVIWAGISAFAATAAAAAEVTAIAVVHALGWLAGHVASILSSTGGMFARVWKNLELFYGNVLKPALVWLHDFYERAKAWLTKVFQPVFKWLYRVRAELLDAYQRYVRPILEIIDVARAILRTLGDLGIAWARALDGKLGELESVITENFLRLLGALNKVITVVNSVVDGSLLFRRSPFLITLDRDAQFWIRMWWNKSLRPDSRSRDAYALGRDYPIDAPFANGKELGQFLRGEDSRMTAYVGELVPLWREAAGIDPPRQDYG